MKRLALATLALSTTALCLSAPAFAADLPSRYAPPPYYDPIPVFAWTGFYAGVNGQFGFGSFSGGAPFGSPVGGLGGVTVGYNYQQGHLLIGAEGDIGFGSIGSTGGGGAFAGSGSVRTLGTARVRVGYIWDRALLYVTGGYAGTSLNGGIGDLMASPNLIISDSHYLNGYAVGLGVEYAITKKISAKAEYLYTGFGSGNFFTGTRDSVSESANVNLIRLGVNYHF